MSSVEYLENIVYVSKMLSDSGINVWTGLQDVLIEDDQINNSVKTAIYSILEERKKITNKSPAVFEREIKKIINDLMNRRWNDLGFTDKLLPSLDIDLRSHLFNKLVIYLLTQLDTVKNKIADIETNGGLFPPIEDDIEEGYGYGYE
jgi:hypothetical protein